MPGLTRRQKEKIERIMQVQKEKTGWNFYHERQHVETLFYNRFNFFLMLYGFFIAAIATLENATNCTICSKIMVGLLIFGIIILFGVWATLWRNYQTLCLILYILDKGLPKYHSSPILSKYMEKNSKICRSKDLMVKWIPGCCIASLCVYLVYLLYLKLCFCAFVFLAIVLLMILYKLIDICLQNVKECCQEDKLDKYLSNITTIHMPSIKTTKINYTTTITSTVIVYYV